MPLILFCQKKFGGVVVSSIKDAKITTPSNDTTALKANVSINGFTVGVSSGASLAIVDQGAVSGKLYFEFKKLADYVEVGLCIANPHQQAYRLENTSDGFGIYLHPTGYYNCTYTGCGYGTGVGFAVGDSVGVAVDLDQRKVDWYKLSGGNVTLVGTSTTANCPIMASLPKPWYPCMADASGSTASGTFNLYGPFINQPAGYVAYSTITPDSQPDAFTFGSAFVDLNVDVESVEVLPVGYNQPTTIAITNGFYKVKHNGVWGAYTNVAGTIQPADSVMVKATSSGVTNGVVTAQVVIGGVTGTFVVTAQPVKVYAKLSSTAHYSTISITNDTKATTTSASWVAGRTDKSIKSGKRYWEVRTGGGTDYGMLGIISASSTNIGMTTAGYLGANFNKSVGLYVLNGGGGYYKNYWTAYSGLMMTASDTIGFVLDYDAGTLTAYKNGVLFGVVISGIAEEVYPAYCLYNSTVNFTFNFGSSGFWNSIPAGCSPI
jgi:hypothetical protein